MPTPALPPSRAALLVMGVAGSGKSACGAMLAAQIGASFVDGDDLHPAANVAKMRGGTPLTDEDRWPWLDKVGGTLRDHSAYPRGVVVACSALRRIYRDRIRASGAAPTFVFLDITPDEARARLSNRPGHFMPASLVDSQFATLERPAADEDDLVVVKETEGVEGTVASVIAALALAGARR